MRNQQINYCFGAMSLRNLRDRIGNQGRQRLALHLARDLTDRLELCFEPISPATLSISLSRCAVGCKNQGPVSADSFFVSQFTRIEAQRSFGVLVARLHGPAQATPPQQITQLPLQIVTHIKSPLIRPILLFVRGHQSNTVQLVDPLRLSCRPVLFHRLALTITKMDGLKSPIRQLLVPIFDRDPLPSEGDAVIGLHSANIDHVLARDVLTNLTAGKPAIDPNRIAKPLLGSSGDDSRRVAYSHLFFFFLFFSFSPPTSHGRLLSSSSLTPSMLCSTST